MKRIRDALIIGDGPAGLLAGIVLRRAGWRVQLATRRKGTRSHPGQTHMIPKPAIEAMEHWAGTRLDGWQVAEHLHIDGAAPACPMTMPLIDPPRLVAALVRRAAETGVTRAAPWASLAAATGGFDLLVDASGSGALASRTTSLIVAIDESGIADEHRSWCGFAGSGTEAWSIAFRDDGLSLSLTRGGTGRCNLTSVTHDPARLPQHPRALLDQIMVTVGHDWTRRIGGVRLAAEPLCRRTPRTRRIRVMRAASGPPLLRIGDALIQTAGQPDQGFARIVEQIELLRPAIEGRAKLQDGIDAVEASAERRWLAATAGPVIRPTIAA